MNIRFEQTHYQRRYTYVKSAYEKMLKSHTTTHLLGCLQSQTLTNTECWWRCGTILICFWWECRIVLLLWTVCQFPIKLSILLPEDPAIMLLDIYPNKVKIYPYKNMHMKVIYGLYSYLPKLRSNQDGL